MMKSNIFRRIEDAVKSHLFKRCREPSIPHQVRHGKRKLKSSGELKRLTKMHYSRDIENHQFLIKSDMANYEK